MIRTKRKPRKTKLSKVAATVLTQRAYGDEPTFTEGHHITRDELANSLNWYSATGTLDDAYKFYKDFFKTQGRTQEGELIAKVPGDWVNRTGAWLTRLVSMGVVLPDSSRRFLELKIKESLAHAVIEQAVEASPPNIQQRIREKNSEFIGEIEGMLDDNNIPDMYEYLKEKSATGLAARALALKLQPRALELAEAAKSVDPQLKEGYQHLSKKQIKSTQETVQRIIDDALRYADNSKKARKPRKKKVVTADKQVSKMAFAARNDQYKLASISPAKIVGASELWVFNAKYKTLGVYRALDSKGLQVRKSFILNVDEANSYAKRIGRKTEEHLNTVLNGGKVALRKLLDSINGDKLENKRITKDVILLRAEK